VQYSLYSKYSQNINTVSATKDSVMTVTPFKVYIKEAADAEADHAGFAAWHEKEANRFAAISASHTEASKNHAEKQKAAQLLGNKQRHEFFTGQIHGANAEGEKAKKISTLHKTIADSHRTLVGLGLGKKSDAKPAEGEEAKAEPKKTVKEDWNALIESYTFAENHSKETAIAEAYAALIEAYSALTKAE
jgi:hypothetical protein